MDRTPMEFHEQRPRGTSAATLAKILIPTAIGSAVAVGLGVYASVHTPAGFSLNVAGFSGTQAVKTWLTTLGFVLALVQLGSALVMYGKIRALPAPAWLGGLHRWSGRLAVLVVVPVVVHCMFALGFQSGSPRVLLHSLLGCIFFGVFAAKMLLLTRKGTPGWVVPVAGGLVFTAITGLWLTSALWVFTTFGVSF